MPTGIYKRIVGVNCGFFNGKHHTEESKKKMSEALTGRKLSEEHIKKIRERLIGNKYSLGHRHSEESKNKVSQNNARYWLGKKRDEKTIEKMRSAMMGRKLSEEHKKKISRGLVGKPSGMLGKKHSAEFAQKMRKALGGKKRPPFSEEWKKNMSKAKMGKKLSEEHKRKMRENSARYWLGKKRQISEEWREKIVKALRGKKRPPVSEKTRKMLREANLGKKRPEYVKRKISDYWKKNPEMHPRWRGGITPFLMKVRHCYKYRQWRSDVFTRDNFTCIDCNKKGGRIEADHYPKMFSKILDEYQIKTLDEALNCEELWNINNGRTRCKECHKKYHK